MYVFKGNHRTKACSCLPTEAHAPGPDEGVTTALFEVGRHEIHHCLVQMVQRFPQLQRASPRPPPFSTYLKKYSVWKMPPPPNRIN